MKSKSIKIISLTGMLILGGAQFSSAKQHTTPKREHHAHVHGSGHIRIAFEGSRGRVELDVPAESILGFEHKAKSIEDRKKTDEALSNIEKNIPGMISFDPALACVWVKERTQFKREGSHSDLEAAFKLSCQRSPAATTLKFAIQNSYPNWKEAEVSVLVDDLQKSVVVRSDGAVLELK